MTWPFLQMYVLAFLFFSANSILNVIIPLYSETKGISNSMIGFIMGAYMLTCMLVRPWAGYLVARYGPIKILRIIVVCNGIGLVLYTMSGLEGFFVARLIQGICTAFFSMALQIGIIDQLPDKERSQGVSMYSLFTYLPTIIGPLIALGIWEWGGMNLFTVAMIGIAVVTALFGLSIPTKKYVHGEKLPPISSVVSIKGFRNLARNKSFILCSVTMLSASLLFGSIGFVPLYADHIQGGNAGIYLSLQAIVVVMTRIIVRKYIPSDGKWHSRYIAIALICASIAALSLSLSIKFPPLLYVAAVLIGYAQAVIYPTLMTYLTFIAPATERNVIVGWFIASADLGLSLGSILMGPIADHLSYSGMYMICATVVGCAALLALAGGKWIVQVKFTGKKVGEV
ncbi:MFS transporter [Paenibacillus sp. GSMTC-2017]|nr:MFS transporter [Paenibacillus sp. GSMTC-2017]